MAVRSIVFKTKCGPAVRLPEAVAFPDEVREVEIVQVGDSRIIRPVGRRLQRSWSDWFLHAPRVSDDFMTERDAPPPEDREPL
jgi:antitoxin VapB